MRTSLAVLLLLATASAVRAEDECTALIDKVQAATKAEVAERSADFARFTAGPRTSLTLSCAGAGSSSVGAQYRGESPPDNYEDLFVQAGRAVTGIDTDKLRDATRQARDQAQSRRHSVVEVAGARLTCAVMKKDDGPLTLCAIIPGSSL